MSKYDLTIRQREAVRDGVRDAMRKRLEERKPSPAQYESSTGGAGLVISQTLSWAKALMPIVVLFAALASSVRTVQTASEIYTAAGSHPVGVLIAAVGFTLGAEAALFILALAQEGERRRRIAEGRPRHVGSLAGLLRALAVRIGIKRPVDYQNMPDSSGAGIVIAVAFLFAVAANFYMGMQPILQELAASSPGMSLQAFLSTLTTAPAGLQVQFIVDVAAVLFPPVMALTGGHLVARWGGELAAEAENTAALYRQDMQHWREAWANPLDTREGAELLRLELQRKQDAKRARYQQQQPEPAAAVNPTPVRLEAHHNGNGNGHHNGA